MILDKNIPLIDTNILIHFFTKDSKYNSAKNTLTKGAYINDLIVCELLNFLTNRFSTYASISVQNLILDSDSPFIFLPITKNIRLASSKIRNKFSDNNFSFTDSLILSQAEPYNLTVYTEDSAMKNYKEVHVVNPLI